MGMVKNWKVLRQAYTLPCSSTGTAVRMTTSRLASITGTSIQPRICPAYHSQGARAKASTKLVVAMENSMVRYTTLTRFLGLGRTEARRLPKIMAMPAQELT